MRTPHALACALAVAATCTAARVEFTNNRLRVDGEPFFFYSCWGTPNRDYVEFRRRHFNTAFMGWKASVTDGPKAADAGLMVIPYPHAPGWSPKVKAAMESIADKDWVLAWNIGDDLNKKEHVEAALKVRGEMRRLDPQRRPIMFDAIGMYDEFAKIPDMWCAYAYPLVKDRSDAHAGGKPGGLREYGEWLKAKRRLGRDDGFFWTWGQCHTQIWYNMKFLGGTDQDKWRPSRFPDGDHMRLIFAHAVSAGCRGFMWFVCYYFDDRHLGRDRYACAASIGCELEVVGPLIAQGRTGERLKTSDPAVWATPIDFPGGRLICLVKTGDGYHYQPDAAEVRDLRVDVAAPGNVYQIGSRFRRLAEPKCSFALTSWLLVTEDDALAQRLRAKHQQALRDMTEFRMEELQARIDKVEPVFKELGEGLDAVREAKKTLAQARAARGDDSRACDLAGAGLTRIRTAQHAVWSKTWTREMLDAGLRVTDFYIIPQQQEQLRLIRSGAWGENRLANGGFESDAGWGGAKLGHTPAGKAALIAGAGRNGTRALRLYSSSPNIYQGRPTDWVTSNVVSEKIPAKPKDVWEIAAWVRVPKELEQTQRGITIALFAYTAEGKRIPGYGAQALEATQVDATDGWRRVRLVVPLRSPAIRFIAARVALCGVGEAYVDDVTVRRLGDPQD